MLPEQIGIVKQKKAIKKPLKIKGYRGYLRGFSEKNQQKTAIRR